MNRVASAPRVVDGLLQRLQGVQATEDGWLAHCPACRSQNCVEVLEAEDNSAPLVACAVCFNLNAILAAVGVTFDDMIAGASDSHMEGTDGLAAGESRRTAMSGRKMSEAEVAMDALLRNVAIHNAGLTEDYERADAAGDFETCERLAATAGYPFKESAADEKPGALVRVDLAGIETASYAAPDYIIQSLLPRGHVTLLGGHGGSGKSMLALTLAAHVANGRDWASLYVAKVPVVFVSLEDRGDLLRHRLRKIIDSYGLNPIQVVGGLTILDGTDFPTLATELVSFGERSLVKTAVMQELCEAARGVGLVIIDNASDAFDGQENDRRQVRAFMRMLAEIARENNAAVCLLAHIDKAAARYGSAGNSYSGSTAWHNSARSRLALLSDEGAVELRQEKLNLGEARAPISLEWTDRGILRPVAFAKRAMDDEHAVYAALRKAIGAGVTVSTATTSQYSASKLLEPYLPPELTGSRGGKRVYRALAALQENGRIQRCTFRDANRKMRERWQLTHE